MTVIAWDGTTLAADKLACYGCQTYTTTKIFRFEKGLLGLAGESGLGLPVVKWVMHGAIADQFPALQSSKDDWQPVLWIDLNGVIHIYERSPIPSIWEDGCCAIGSGREYAMAAMHLGCSAKEAVEVANALSCDCGRGVDVLDLRVAK
jgi:20S proteasome alpha/beta subunit